MATETIIGGRMLDTLSRDRLSIGLYGPSNSGKSTNAASFGGGDWGKVLFFNIESGPAEGAGGATPLLYLTGIHPRIKGEDVRVVDVRDWADMMNQFRWMQRDYRKLLAEGYRVLVIDGGTELCRMLEVALTSIDPTKLKGNTNQKGEEDSAKKNHKRELVPDLTGTGGRALEWDDYSMIHDRFKHAVDISKALPFLTVWTFLEGQGYDEVNTKVQSGIGPDATGRKLPSRIPSWFDCFFHCEQNEAGAFRWLTRNNPRVNGGANGPYFAKNRFGNTLRDYEMADGAALLKKLGVKAPLAPTVTAPPTPPTPEVKP